MAFMDMNMKNRFNEIVIKYDSLTSDQHTSYREIEKIENFHSRLKTDLKYRVTGCNYKVAAISLLLKMSDE